MNKNDLLKLAKLHCIFDASRTKAALIRAIHDLEGNFECFNTVSMGDCHDQQCGWREDCLLEWAHCSPARGNHAALNFPVGPQTFQWAD